jgi:hypothetical protein
MQQQVENFVQNELDNYSKNKARLEEDLALGIIDMDEYIQQLSILNRDRNQLRKQNKINKKERT